MLQSLEDRVEQTKIERRKIKKELRDAYLELRSGYKVAEKLGIPYYKIFRLFKKHNIRKYFPSKRKILGLYNRLANTAEVAKACFISQVILYKLLKKYEIDVSKLIPFKYQRKIRPPKEEVEMIYEEKKDCWAVAEIYGVSPKTVWKWLFKYNIKRFPRKIPVPDIAKVREDYAKLGSFYKLSRKYGVSCETARCWIKNPEKITQAQP